MMNLKEDIFSEKPVKLLRMSKGYHEVTHRSSNCVGYDHCLNVSNGALFVGTKVFEWDETAISKLRKESPSAELCFGPGKVSETTSMKGEFNVSSCAYSIKKFMEGHFGVYKYMGVNPETVYILSSEAHLEKALDTSNVPEKDIQSSRVILFGDQGRVRSKLTVYDSIFLTNALETKV